MKPRAIVAAIIAAITLLASAAALAQSNHPMGADAAPASAGQAKPWTEGEVRKVDSDQGTVTLRHGAIANLGMPAMTMVFTAADPKLLTGLAPGNKVRFRADRPHGSLTVTAIESIN